MSADGPEQRTAELDERIARDVEFDALIDDADEVVVLSDEERIAELKALLADIVQGAHIMLQPACGLQGAMLGYVREVKRVASAGRDI
jgi:glycine cleavage system protein P-like pyridoxal-binding family